MQAKNTVRVDYLVVTALLSAITDEEAERLLAKTFSGDPFALYGYKGYKLGNLFVGENGKRIIIQATGSNSASAIELINPQWEGLSVARLDLQLTVLVPDADSVIRGTNPPSAYKSVRMVNLHERGSTLYVGSPKSRCRLRMYNKTAEANEERVLGNEKLRIELQFRDDYADRALLNVMKGTADMFYRYYVLKMTDGYITNLIDRVLQGKAEAIIDKDDSFDSLDRRKQWLEHTVIPALSKLYLIDPDWVKEYLTRVKELLD